MDLIDRVRQLIDAENQADPQKAGEVLARDFVAITRSDGEEERSALLKRIGNPPEPEAFREPDEFGEWKSGELGVVRSLVRTKGSATQAVSGEFRNLHVFKKEASTWVCVDWQATKLKRRSDTGIPKDQVKVTKEYEDGKHRRYSLLFAVNGGAFAVAKLLADKAGSELVGNLSLEHLALGMALFTTVMAVDIDAFARRMKKHDQDLYQAIGVFVLLAIGSLIVAGWMSIASASAWAVLAVIAQVGVILGCHFYSQSWRRLRDREGAS